MWRYYQTSAAQNEQWKEAQLKEAESVRTSQASHMTTLACSEPTGPDTDYEKALYQGKFVLDLDNKHNLQAAITDLHVLLRYLVDSGISQNVLEIFCSGSKGFHVLVPQVVITGSNRPTKQLPAIYKNVAIEIGHETGITSIDLGQYNGKRGSMLRVENKRRPDGKYKVPITFEEALAITPELYVAYTAEPRFITVSDETPVTSSRMLLLVRRAMTTIEAAKRAQAYPTPLELLADFGDGFYPECVVKVVRYDKLAPEKNFHDFATQIAAFVKAVPLSATALNNLIYEFAKNSHSSQYDSVQARVTHTKQQVEDIAKREWSFSCGAMRDVIGNCGNMCSGCPVKRIEGAGIAQEQSIVTTPGGYFRVSPTGVMTQLTNFVFDLTLIKGDPDTARDSWDDKLAYIGARAKLKVKDTDVTTVDISNKAFLGRREFKESVIGYRGTKVLASDTDVQDLHEYIFTEVREMGNTPTIYTAGLNNLRLGENEEYKVWVDRKGQLSSMGVDNLAIYQGTYNNVKELSKFPVTPDMKVRSGDVLHELLHTNTTDVVGRILGWMCACHIKPHLHNTLGQQFPLLHIAGQRGSGKTLSTKLYTAIAGADYQHNSPMTVDTATAAPIRIAAAQSMSVPHVFDEVNPSKMPLSRYQPVLNTLKAAYSQGNMAVGGLSSKPNQSTRYSAQSNELICSTPLVYLATTLSSDAELTDRSVDVPISHLTHAINGCNKRFERLLYGPDTFPALWTLARVLVNNAMVTEDEWVWNNYVRREKSMPEEVRGRPRTGLAVVFTGLDFLLHVLRIENYQPLVINSLTKVIADTEHWLTSSADWVAHRKERTEMDSFMEIMSVVATESSGGNLVLIPGVAYFRDEERLFINPPHCFSQYMKHCSQTGRTREYTSVPQLDSQFSEQPYYIGREAPPGSTDGRPWVLLSIDKLREKGIDTSTFKE